jgi:uncharacterized protein (TIGR02145 family)
MKGYINSFIYIIATVFYILQVSCEKENNVKHETLQFTDERDGNSYRYVQIGDQYWMAENLAYLPKVNTLDEGYEDFINGNVKKLYYVYGYSGANIQEAKLSENYITHGVLYNWNAAMDGDSSSSKKTNEVQGVCPTGWHLPSEPEWEELINYLGGATIAGQHLKDTIIWFSGLNKADNSSGFSASPSGRAYFQNGGDFDGIKWFGYIYSSTLKGKENALYYKLSSDAKNILPSVTGSLTEGMCIRCVMDK